MPSSVPCKTKILSRPTLSPNSFNCPGLLWCQPAAISWSRKPDFVNPPVSRCFVISWAAKRSKLVLNLRYPPLGILHLGTDLSGTVALSGSARYSAGKTGEDVSKMFLQEKAGVILEVEREKRLRTRSSSVLNATVEALREQHGDTVNHVLGEGGCVFDAGRRAD